MDFLVRFVQMHEDFRLAEIAALAALAGVQVEVVSYSIDVRQRFHSMWLCFLWRFLRGRLHYQVI